MKRLLQTVSIHPQGQGFPPVQWMAFLKSWLLASAPARIISA